MKRGNRPELLWGLGLNKVEAVKIKNSLGPGFFLRNFSESSLPGDKEMVQSEKPSAAWIPLRVWSGLPENRKNAYRELESTQKILIQDDDNPMDLENVLEEGFLTVVSSPLTSSKVKDALFRAKEVSGLYGDIYRMTEQIMLEREILSRKTEQLTFLNTLLANATESLEPAEILGRAEKDMGMILPILSLQAVFWNKIPASEKLEAEIFLKPGMSEDIRSQWLNLMLENSSVPGESVTDSYELNCTRPVEGNQRFVEGPAEGRVLVLPLASRGEKFGSLVMLCDKSVRLAKDQVSTINSAVSHLSLALHNALMFRRISTRADHDGLTRVYNRRSFDERLVEELKRHQRHNLDLSLLMVDLDHFKNINDSYGHLAGDMVLERTARIFEKTLRATDFIARYGGEEFVLLLPHTKIEQARMLAERVRTKIEETEMDYCGTRFNITASIGVTSMRPGALESEESILEKADKALYNAKNSGRNRVVTENENKGQLHIV
jgi:diguanylate cyclase (GGDEF)-like protein